MIIKKLKDKDWFMWEGHPYIIGKEYEEDIFHCWNYDDSCIEKFGGNTEVEKMSSLDVSYLVCT